MSAESEQSLQRAYYARTAHGYDQSHTAYEPEHNIALRYIAALLAPLSTKTVLDVGCGTGRGLEHIRNFDPGLAAFGVEPVHELLEVAVEKGIRPSMLIRGDACALPFGDGTIDVVMALAVMHHVPRPELVVNEMLRVAKKAVFISDSNLFGQGRIPMRFVKFLLYKVGLWNLIKTIQTGGRGYTVTEGDGLAYAYSIFFQYDLLAQWADRVFAVPLASGTEALPWPVPLFGNRCVLLCAMRDSP
jgi:ubiquinone/menaquinone biosynthesis C-methylase UbiE